MQPFERTAAVAPLALAASPGGTMRARFSLAVLAGLTGCGGDGPTDPPPDRTVVDVQVIRGEYTALRNGDTVRFRAEARDAARELVEDAPITWSSSVPAVATVDAGGIVTARGYLEAVSWIRATSGSVTDSGQVGVQGWRLDRSTDGISGRPRVLLFTTALAGPGQAQVVFRCREGIADAYLNFGGVTAHGQVRYRVGTGAPHDEVWEEATDFGALFYPGPAAGFASVLAGGTELIFEHSEFGGGTEQHTFVVAGISSLISQVTSACP